MAERRGVSTALHARGVPRGAGTARDTTGGIDRLAADRRPTPPVSGTGVARCGAVSATEEADDVGPVHRLARAPALLLHFHAVQATL